MRVNVPVTNEEYVLPEGEVIVSRTDPKGRITYVNEAFIRSSGFSRDESMGQPHNFIRHPDMPPEAFADLWITIKAGKPWSALVKNRRKNSGFYWVKANVTPMVDGGRITGYMSVRTKPSRAEIDGAAELSQDARRTGTRHRAGGRSAYTHGLDRRTATHGPHVILCAMLVDGGHTFRPVHGCWRGGGNPARRRRGDDFTGSERGGPDNRNRIWSKVLGQSRKADQ